MPDAYGTGDLPQSSSTAQYWCLKTMRADGPDGALALPEDCTDERVCFEARWGERGQLTDEAGRPAEARLPLLQVHQHLARDRLQGVEYARARRRDPSNVGSRLMFSLR